jgi:dihydroxy-acid dehydratase
MGHTGTFHFRGLVEEVSNGVFEAGGKPGVFTVSDICDGVVQATQGMSYSLISRDIMAGWWRSTRSATRTTAWC